MNKVLLIGAGGVGSVVAHKCAMVPEVFGEITLASRTKSKCDAIAASVKRTNRVLILHEDTLFGGIGGEIAAWIGEHLFELLDAPVLRAASLDTPVPFAIPLEQNFFPVERVKEQLKKLKKY